ncbi:MAG: type II secretion system F family protein [Phoenicibacter congonensis]|uniref:Type II secretion system F family protein n=1 Tax=Phoenicibacter congonensis TaxID=1944646 RepID=A0AA43RIU1_9ACTN|nr:type II secretion system F family protein [Phoenicibacter congonensis]
MAPQHCVIIAIIFVCLCVCIFNVICCASDFLQRQRIAWALGVFKKAPFLKSFAIKSEAIFGGLSSRLLEYSFVKKGASSGAILLEFRGINCKDSTFVSCLLFVCVVTAAVGFLASFSFVFALCSAIVVFVGTLLGANSRLSRAMNDIREQVPDAIRCMSTCTKCGLSLLQTFEQASHECKGALGKVFALAHRRLNLGATVLESLEVFDTISSVPELKFIGLAFSVQHVTGGPISDVLDFARESVLNELELARTLRIQTTQAKMSATIVTLMPFILLAAFSFLSPGFLSPFFSSFIGATMLAIAIGMQALGVLIVRKILSDCEG